MNRLLLRNIFAILLYTGFFTVQLGANFLIQENIKFRNDFNCLEKLEETTQKSNHSLFKTDNNFSKHKKSNMSRRFIPEDIKQSPVIKYTEYHFLDASIVKISLKTSILSHSDFQLVDRGPPISA
jgi:hypothetical protein